MRLSSNDALLEDDPPAPSAEVGQELIPGYRLIEPLGKGGFGEVWKCEAPGGLLKAIKLVNGDLGLLDGVNSAATSELEALERIKVIRHPFLLSIDRIEIVDGRLIIVTELADQSLSQLREEYQKAGKPGIPRDELLHYLGEAAEALDLMSFQHDLQHLDVKPHNLFLVSNHIKVADFGLVYGLRELNGSNGVRPQAGFSVLYAAPETLQNRVSRHSDQYSLAIVYQELLTGTLPFQGKSANHLMIQHLSAEPNLMPLPEADRAMVGRALSKDPDQRFPSCLDFLQALAIAHETNGKTAGAVAPLPIKATRIFRSLKALPKSGADAPNMPRQADGQSRPDHALRHNSKMTGVEGREASNAAYRALAACPKLKDYRVLEVLSQDSLGEICLIEGSDGRERCARFLPGFPEGEGDSEARPANRFRQLRHSTLLPTELLPVPSGGLMLVTDLITETLADRFRECSAEGAPGIPRDEVLEYLRTSAKALDQLYAEHGVRHLRLSPRTLVIEKDQLRLADFGLVELFWLTRGQSAAACNRRYGDPQLEIDEKCPSADQYSLALIYAEMLTRVHPSPLRPKVRSGVIRGAAPINLDFLPVTDREVVARALDIDPRGRFASCTELVEALEAARLRAAAPREVRRSLPSVVSIDSLTGKDISLQPAPPLANQLLTGFLEAPNGAAANGAKAEQCAPSQIPETLEQSFLIESLPISMVTLKLDGFRMESGAQLVRSDESSLQYLLGAPRTFWQRRRGEQPGLTISVILDPLPETKTKLTRAKVQIRAVGAGGAEERRMLGALGPGMLKSICSYLQVAPNARARARQALREPLHVYPVLPDLNLAPALQGMGRDFSRDGIGFFVREAPKTELIYVHLHATRQLATFALLARVRWVKPTDNGWYRVGAVFETDTSET